MKVFDADPIQDSLVERIQNDPSGAFLNGSGTGQGKTIVAIRGALARGAKRVLIIAQPKVFENFEGTLKSLTGIQLRACGNQKFVQFSAAEMKENMDAATRGEDGWFFVSRELFSRQCWVKKEITSNGAPVIDPKTKKVRTKSVRIDYWSKRSPFDVVVYDECQMLSDKTSKSNQSFKWVRANYKIAQSADWFGSFIENQWSISKALWTDWETRNHAEWIDEFCETEFYPFSYTKKKVVGEIWPGFYAASLPNYIAIPSPVEKPEITRHYVDLSATERRMYNELNEKMAVEIDGDLLVTEMNLHLTMRLRELCLGEFRIDYVDRRNKETGEMEVKQTIDFDEGAPSTTVEAIKQIQSDYPGEPIIVVSHSAKWARKAAKDLGGLPYTGAESEKQKEENKQAFLRGDVKILVGTDAMTEGLDGLQAVCRIGVIASRLSRAYLIEQFLGRTARRGQEREPLAFEVVRRGTIDVGVVHASIERIIANNAAKAMQKKEEK